MFQLISAVVAAALLPQLAAADQRATCGPDRGPRIVTTAYADYPALAELAGRTGTATVRVDLAGDGTLAGASVAESSGTDALDRAAVRAVKAMRYAPEVRSCTTVPGSYAVDVRFGT